MTKMSFISNLERKLVHSFYLLPPDIHERQRFIASKIFRNQTILDVGGEQAILQKIAKAKDYYQVNIADEINQSPKYLKNQHSKDRVKSLYYDGKKLPFKNQSFDVVVCVDVLEHVAKKDRMSLIKEMLRVSRKKLICSAPMGTKEHITAEKELYQAVSDKKQVAFLQDHIKHGLPSPTELEKWQDSFDAELIFSGDCRWSNFLYKLQVSQLKIKGLSHLYFFFKLIFYALCNVFLYPFLFRKKYSAYTNRFYLMINK